MNSSCCDTQLRLAEAFATNARLYAEAVVNLTGIRDLSEERFDKLRTAVKAAQERAERARVAYEEYLDGHRCTLRTHSASA